ncbi:hypothetical protein LTR36_006560 [Oleoguttula mirabilis]|uniref:Glycoside hydrolase n=1 Tax=Oleoguttula mirabilis TaxID=1507867 RepID=A0AAV9JVG9_9PEZI|nr:hypothetical protein LTR36_006560 [Oleoguttula mirabilis]
MSDSLPQGAWAASILVLIYSVICLGAIVLLLCMLFANGEKTNYVTLIALVTSVSTTASIVQQVYYACHWRTTKSTELQQAKASLETPTIAYTPLSTGLNLALFEMQFTCYTISSVLILFWAMALAKGVYNLRFKSLLGREASITASAKVFAVVTPIVLIGITFVDAVQQNVVAYLIISNIVLIGSLVIGSIIMIAVLVRYVYSRHLFRSIQGSTSAGTAHSETHPGQPVTAKIKVDKMLLLRFTIAFVILNAFEVSLLSFEFLRKINARTMAAEQQPDFSVGGAISDIEQFIPGVTAALLAFLLFGTTAQFRKKYGDAFRSMRCRRSRRPTPVQATGGTGAWNTLGSNRPLPTYRCTIGAGDAESVELQDSGNAGKTRPDVTVQDEDSLLGRSMSSRRLRQPVPQPWNAIGAPRP